MQTYLDCIPCFFKQALESARIAKTDIKIQKEILNILAGLIPDFSLELTPPEIAVFVNSLLKEKTGKEDIYKDLKVKSNNLALSVYDKLKKKVDYSKDKLLTAVELAIAGNIIDYGAKNSLDVDKEIDKLIKEENQIIKNEDKKLFNYEKFKTRLESSKTILYLGDNAGEIVFDRILIEEICSCYKDKNIIFAVREKPVINDVLFEDAVMCGVDKIAQVISSGSYAPGTVLSLCSEEFLKIYNNVDMIISKGQGNFEALSDEKKSIFYLFIAKCPVIANHVGGRLGDIILLYSLDKSKKS
jgi:damage-control phosphatase, subfamily I